MAWEFLRKQGQLLSFAQVLNGRQSADPSQPACVGNPPGAGLGEAPSSVKSVPLPLNVTTRWRCGNHKSSRRLQARELPAMPLQLERMGAPFQGVGWPHLRAPGAPWGPKRNPEIGTPPLALPSTSCAVCTSWVNTQL